MKTRAVFLALFTSSIAGMVVANGLGGKRLEKVVNGQIVDVGTNQTSAPVAGAPIQFDFNLLKSDTRATLPTTNVAVSFEHKGAIVMDSDLLMEPPLTLLVFTFPEKGDYTLTVTFYNKDQKLAAASVPLSIGATFDVARALYLTLSVILGIAIGYWGAQRRSSRKKHANSVSP